MSTPQHAPHPSTSTSSSNASFDRFLASRASVQLNLDLALALSRSATADAMHPNAGGLASSSSATLSGSGAGMHGQNAGVVQGPAGLSSRAPVAPVGLGILDGRPAGSANPTSPPRSTSLEDPMPGSTTPRLASLPGFDAALDKGKAKATFSPPPPASSPPTTETFKASTKRRETRLGYLEPDASDASDRDSIPPTSPPPLPRPPRQPPLHAPSPPPLPPKPVTPVLGGMGALFSEARAVSPTFTISSPFVTPTLASTAAFPCPPQPPPTLSPPAPPPPPTKSRTPLLSKSGSRPFLRSSSSKSQLKEAKRKAEADLALRSQEHLHALPSPPPRHPATSPPHVVPINPPLSSHYRPSPPKQSSSSSSSTGSTLARAGSKLGAATAKYAPLARERWEAGKEKSKLVAGGMGLAAAATWNAAGRKVKESGVGAGSGERYSEEERLADRPGPNGAGMEEDHHHRVGSPPTRNTPSPASFDSHVSLSRHASPSSHPHLPGASLVHGSSSSGGPGSTRLPATILGVKVPNRRGEVFARPLEECLDATTLATELRRGSSGSGSRIRADSLAGSSPVGSHRDPVLIETLSPSLSGSASPSASGQRERRGPDAVLEEAYLPAVAVRCMEYLNEWGTTEEGVYRVPGRSSDIERLRVIFDAGCDLDLRKLDASQLDPHAVASVFKLWLRELPGSLLSVAESDINDLLRRHTGSPATLVQSFHAFSNGGPPTPVLSPDPSVSPVLPASPGEAREPNPLLTRLSEIISTTLPQRNWYLLRAIAVHLGHLVAHAEFNRMTLANLRLILSPTLRFTTAFLELVVEHRDELFARPCTTAPRISSRGSSPTVSSSGSQWATLRTSGTGTLHPTSPSLTHDGRLSPGLPGIFPSTESLGSSSAASLSPRSPATPTENGRLSPSLDPNRLPIADKFKRTSPVLDTSHLKKLPDLPPPPSPGVFVPTRGAGAGLFTGGASRWNLKSPTLGEPPARRRRQVTSPAAMAIAMAGRRSPDGESRPDDDVPAALPRSPAHISIPIRWGGSQPDSRASTAEIERPASTFPVDADAASQYTRDSVFSRVGRFSTSSHMDAFPSDAAAMAANFAHRTTPTRPKSASLGSQLSSAGSSVSASASSHLRHPSAVERIGSLSRTSTHSPSSSLGSRSDADWKRNTAETSQTSIRSHASQPPKLDMPILSLSSPKAAGSRDSEAALASWLTIEERIALFSGR